MGSGENENYCARCVLATALSQGGGGFAEADELQTPASLLRRRHFADYELIEEIARGGMGVVFRARQRKPERTVALKVIAAGELASSRAVERFHAEAGAAARLEHPNIVPIYEVGEHDGWNFFSMRLIEGATLAETIGGNPMEPSRAARIVSRICRALHHAHQRGILHRDLKPNNILLDREGIPHLTDFGLAKILNDREEFTRTHAVLGTLAYMAPEQASGGARDVTVAADVYGMGAAFYEMLTGKPPFVVESAPETLRAIAEREPVPPSRINGQTPADLEVICLRCLAKQPAERYGDALELAEDIERWLRHEPIHARSSSLFEKGLKWARRHPAITSLTAALAAMFVVLAVVLIAYNFRLSEALSDSESIARESNDRLISHHLHEATAQAWRGRGWIGALSLSEAVELAKGDPVKEARIQERLAINQRFSPRLLRLWAAAGVPHELLFSSGQNFLIATMEGGSVQVWDLKRNAIVQPPGDVMEAPIASAVSQDGDRILQLLDSEPYARLWRLDTDQLVPLTGLQTEGSVCALSHDGSVVAIGGVDVQIRNMATGETINASPGPYRRCVWLGFDPVGERLLGVDADGNGRLWDVETGEQLNTVALKFQANAAGPKFCDDGRRLLADGGDKLMLLDLPSGARVRSFEAAERLFDFNFQPGERTIATASWKDQVRLWDVSNSRQVGPPISHDSGANRAVFSPDGKWMATAGFDYQLRIIHMRSVGQAEPAFHHNGLIEAAAFCPDARFLATAGQDRVVRVWDLTWRQARFLPQACQGEFSHFSPDGRYIVGYDGSQRLRVWDVIDGKEHGTPMAFEGRMSHVIFDPKQRYIAAAGNLGKACLWDFATRELLHIFELPGGISSVEFSPDGEQLVTSSAEGMAQRWSTADGTAVGGAMNHGDFAKLLQWSSDGRWIVTGGGTGASVWDAASGQRVGERIEGSGGPITVATFCNDSRRLLVAFGNKTIEPSYARVYELPSLRPLTPELPHGDGVYAATFSPNGERVVTGAEDNTLRSWRVSDGQPAAPTVRMDHIVCGLAYRPDGRMIAAGSWDGQMLLLDPDRGELAAPPLYMPRGTWRMRFSSDNKRLMVGMAAGMPWIFELEDSRMSVASRKTLSELASGFRLNPNGGVFPILGSEQADAFEKLASQNPDSFVWPEDMEGHHAQNAAEAELCNDRVRASFHLRRLVALHPEDEALKKRLAAAR